LVLLALVVLVVGVVVDLIMLMLLDGVVVYKHLVLALVD
jgi:hypothetical protein